MKWESKWEADGQVCHALARVYDPSQRSHSSSLHSSLFYPVFSRTAWFSWVHSLRIKAWASDDVRGSEELLKQIVFRNHSHSLLFFVPLHLHYFLTAPINLQIFSPASDTAYYVQNPLVVKNDSVLEFLESWCYKYIYFYSS